MQNTLIVQTIQAMLAPGIMISACGLLLLGVNNRYSSVINRIRMLDQERRTLRHRPDAGPDDILRLDSIDHQLAGFRVRVILVRDAILSYASAIALFIGSSLLLGLSSVWADAVVRQASMGLFLAGMVSVLVGATFVAREVLKGHEIVIIEIDGDMPHRKVERRA